jgi:hypothetical protein
MERAAMIASNISKLGEMELSQGENLARDAIRGLEKQQMSEVKTQPKQLKGSEAGLKKQYKSTLKRTEETFRSSFSTLRTMPADTREASLLRHNAEKTEKLLELESGHRADISVMRKDATTAMAKRHHEELNELNMKNAMTLVDLRSYQAARFEVHQQQAAHASTQLEEELEEEANELEVEIGKEVALVAEMTEKISELQQKHTEAKALLQRTANKR